MSMGNRKRSTIDDASDDASAGATSSPATSTRREHSASPSPKAIDWDAYTQGGNRLRFEDAPINAAGQKELRCNLPGCDKLVTSKNYSRHLRQHGFTGTLKKGKGKPVPKYKCPHCLEIKALSKYKRHYKSKHPEVYNAHEAADDWAEHKPTTLTPDAHTNDDEVGSAESEDDAPTEGNHGISVQAPGPSKRVRTNKGTATRPRAPVSTEQLPTPPTNQLPQTSSRAHFAEPQHVDFDAIFRAYCQRTVDEFDEGKELIKESEEKFQRKSPSLRINQDIRSYRECLNDASFVMPMTFADYEKAIAEGKSLKRSWLVVNEDQARTVLQMGPLRVPMVVPAALRKTPQDNWTMEEFFLYLRTFDDVHVHAFAQERPAHEQYALPIKMKTQAAIEALQAPDGWINLLDLHDPGENRTPAYLLNLRQYRPMLELRETNSCGKIIDPGPRDFSSCQSFGIVGSRGVFSFKHQDHGGVVTFATVQRGRKLWLSYPHQDPLDTKHWAFFGEPVGKPFPISLNTGDDLIQPQGRPHAPLSLTCVWMTGLMRLDSRDMARSAYLTVAETYHGHLTNEEPALEWSNKGKRMHELWANGDPVYPWSTKPEELRSYKELLLLNDEALALKGYVTNPPPAISSTRAKTTKTTKGHKKASAPNEPKSRGCNCLGDCTTNACSCKKLGRACDIYCHWKRSNVTILCDNWNLMNASFLTLSTPTSTDAESDFPPASHTAELEGEHFSDAEGEYPMLLDADMGKDRVSAENKKVSSDKRGRRARRSDQLLDLEDDPYDDPELDADIEERVQQGRLSFIG